MIDVSVHIPKELQRPALEEYHKFLKGIHGVYSFRSNVRYTMDETKLTKKELKDDLHKEARSIVANEDFETFFLLVKNENEDVNAIGRATILLNSLSMHLCEIIYLNYPTEEEKESIIKEILEYLEYYTKKGVREYVSLEVPRNDSLLLYTALDSGYNYIDEDKSITNMNQTIVLEKEIKREKELTRKK